MLSNDKKDWRNIQLSNDVTIKSVHPCTLRKWKGKELTKAMEVAQASGVDTDEDESKWFCNGGSDEEGFVGGCKSG